MLCLHGRRRCPRRFGAAARSELTGKHGKFGGEGKLFAKSACASMHYENGTGLLWLELSRLAVAEEHGKGGMCSENGWKKCITRFVKKL